MTCKEGWMHPDITIQEGKTMFLNCSFKSSRERYAQNAEILKLVTLEGVIRQQMVFNGMPTRPILLSHFKRDELKRSLNVAGSAIVGVVDSGTYLCKRRDDKVEKANSQLKVIVIPLITSFYLEQNGIDNERVSMNEGSTIRLDNKVSNAIYCIAHTNSIIDQYVDIDIKVGRNLESAESIKYVTNITKNILGESYMVYNELISEVKVTRQEMPAEWNNRKLFCLASLGEEKKVMTYSLQVKFKPKVTCSKTEAMSKEEEEVQFVCTIHSNPSSVISWTNQKGIILGDKYSRYTMKKETIDDDIVRVTLKITQLIKDDLKATYTLKAKNDLGENSIQLKIFPRNKEAPRYKRLDDESHSPPTQNVKVSTILGMLLMVACLY